MGKFDTFCMIIGIIAWCIVILVALLTPICVSFLLVWQLTHSAIAAAIISVVIEVICVCVELYFLDLVS